MASSSSSSHLIPASSSQLWNHEVFLSFRGEDTRKNFVDHLYTALVQQGTYTFKDDETLDRGESIGPALLKAIQESRIAVIVFSKSYADSSWCLDELAHIIECKEYKGQIVMPVFYDIDPLDVRKQNGKYGEAFAKNERENKHKVESWRKALVEAGNLSGWVPKDFANGHEAKCIKDIVGTIYDRLSQLITSDNKDLIGIETRLQDLKLKLEIGSGGVRMVGILGVGGGGKTTLASAAYMEISHKFEAQCFLENIRDESSKHGLKKLQEIFLSLVLKTDVVVGSEMEGKSLIKKRLCHKSVLVVLDDVDALKQLEALAGSHDWFGEGSRIIITTRDAHVLSRRANTIYEVSLLSHDEATKLFTRHAYQKDKPIEDYDLLSKEIVSYANGLPLALEVLGSFLYDKDKDEWKAALARLKCIPDVAVTERLKISYDGLEPDQKVLFLDVACFLKGYKIDEAMMDLDACSFHPRIGVKVLVQKSLIKVSDGRFDMHDLIQEMAHYIVRGEYPNNPEKHSRIWKEEDIDDLCANGAVAPLMETEVLRLASYHRHPRLGHAVANMKKLRWFEWIWYPESAFPSNFQSTELGLNGFGMQNQISHQIFRVGMDGLQKQLWKECKRLPNLKILNLSYSENLITTPDFEDLPCLERLILCYCDNLKEIHPSIGYHKRLVFVDMKNCKKLEAFPPILSMKKLETLNLIKCFKIQNFPDIQTSMVSLENLNFARTGIEVIPPSVGQFCTSLVSFDLSECRQLKRIADNFYLLKNLKDLNLYVCYRLGQQDVNLKFLQLPRLLRKLDLGWCDLGDGNIPLDICELLNLQVLYLYGNIFSRIPFSLSRITSLKLLNLSRCKSLVELPDLPLSIAILGANYCDSLESVGDLSKYKRLWKVSFLGCDKLIDGERVPHPMLQVNAVQDRLMSVRLPDKAWYSVGAMISITLQLPNNWYSNFSGFLLSTYGVYSKYPLSIVIKQEMYSMDSQLADDDYWEEFDKNLESYKYSQVGYVPFALFRHISWWNSADTRKLTFKISGRNDFKVGLVPRKAGKLVGDSREKAEGKIDYSECWNEDFIYTTFDIKFDSNSSDIEILWSHKLGRI